MVKKHYLAPESAIEMMAAGEIICDSLALSGGIEDYVVDEYTWD